MGDGVIFGLGGYFSMLVAQFVVCEELAKPLSEESIFGAERGLRLQGFWG